jgi:hypothetical protein
MFLIQGVGAEETEEKQLARNALEGRSHMRDYTQGLATDKPN